MINKIKKRRSVYNANATHLITMLADIWKAVTVPRAEGSMRRTAKFHVSPERCAENPRLAEH